MPMYGLPQGLLNPPRPLSEDDSMNVPDRGWLGQTPGTMILVLVFLAAFAVYYFTNWKQLAFIWKIG